MNTTEIVIREMQRKGCFQIVQFLAESGLFSACVEREKPYNEIGLECGLPRVLD
jgi:hypothetical protein